MLHSKGWRKPWQPMWMVNMTWSRKSTRQCSQRKERTARPSPSTTRKASLDVEEGAVGELGVGARAGGGRAEWPPSSLSTSLSLAWLGLCLSRLLWCAMGGGAGWWLFECRRWWPLLLCRVGVGAVLLHGSSGMLSVSVESWQPLLGEGAWLRPAGRSSWPSAASLPPTPAAPSPAPVPVQSNLWPRETGLWTELWMGLSSDKHEGWVVGRCRGLSESDTPPPPLPATPAYSPPPRPVKCGVSRSPACISLSLSKPALSS